MKSLNRPCVKHSLARALNVIGLVLSCAVFSLAEPNPADLALKADKDLRAAERAMFAGKKEDADALLREVGEALTRLREDEPSNPKLGMLQSKFDKLRRDLNQRMGAGRDNDAAASSPAAPPPQAPAARTTAGRVGGAADSAAVARAVGKASRDVDFALGKIDRLIAQDDSVLSAPMTAAQKKQEADQYLAEAKGYLSQMLEKYGNAVDPASAEVKTIAAKIESAGAKADAWAKDLAATEQRKASADAGAAGQKEQAMEILRADAESMAALYDKYYKQVEGIHGNSLFYGTEVKEAEQALATIEQAEKALLPDLAPEMGRLAELYGSRGMDIYNKFFEAGYKLEGNVEGHFEQLLQAVAKIPASRKETAKGVAAMADTLFSAFSGQLTDARIERMQNVKALLVVGSKIDPDNKQIGEMLSKIDDQIAETADKMTAAIDAARWPGDVEDFPGPGNVKVLAEEAVKFFRNHPNWKDTGHNTEVLAVAIRGPWQVAERDIFGRVISWRLPALVASTDERFRPRNIARVLEVSILAKEGAADNAPKAPPFDGYWVGNNWMMRLNNL